MKKNINWLPFNKFPEINFQMGSITYSRIDRFGYKGKYSIKNIDPLILYSLKQKPPIAEYTNRPNSLMLDNTTHDFIIKVVPNKALIDNINKTLMALKGYTMYKESSEYYIRDYSFGQTCELLDIYPLVTTEGKIINLADIFHKLTIKAKISLINIYKKDIFIKFPLPKDIVIDWSDI